MPDIVESGLFIVSFIVLLSALVLFPKSSVKQSGVKWIVVSYVTAWSYCATGCAFLHVLHIPINLFSLSILCFFASACIYGSIFLFKKKCQAVYFNRYDLGMLILLTVLFSFAIAKTYGFHFDLRYRGSDPAVHFQYAMAIVRSEDVNGMFFVPLHNAVYIELCSPFLSELDYYRAFILSDSVMTLLEIFFFYILVREYATTKIMKRVIPFICVLYAMGYPIYSYIDGGFIHWGVGVLITEYLLFLLKFYLEDEHADEWMLLTGLMLGAIACVIGYMLFAPMVYLALILCYAICYRKRVGKIKSGFCLRCLYIFLPGCIMGYWFCLRGFFNISFSGTQASASADAADHSIQVISDSLNLMGGTYGTLWNDFIFLMPFVLYIIIRCIRNKEADIHLLFFSVFILFTICMFAGVMSYKISSYYYYKMYYLLWLMAWLMTARFFTYLEDMREKTFVKSYIATGVLLLLIACGNINVLINNRNPWIEMGKESNGNFPIYRYTVECLKRNYREQGVDTEKLETFSRVMELRGHENTQIPFITSLEKVQDCYWYDAITGYNSSNYYSWNYSIQELKEKLNQGDVQYFVIEKDSEVYSQLKEYIDSYEKVFENEQCLIAKNK